MCVLVFCRQRIFILEILDVNSTLFPGKCYPETGEVVDISHHAFKKSDLVIVSGNKYDHR